MRTAIYDLDRTITKFGTYTPFLLWYCSKNNPLRLLFVPIILLCMIGYKFKFLDRKQLKTIMFQLLVGTPRRDTFTLACKNYAGILIAKHCYADALETISTHKRKGDKLVLATASYDWLAEEIGIKLGFDDVVATKSVKTDEYIRPGVEGDNCYGPHKLAMVSDVLGPFSNDGKDNDTLFYTDHHTDIALLEKCTHPIIVNGTRKLIVWAEATPAAQIVQWQ